MVVEPGQLLGFKIVPGTAVSMNSFSGQTEADWSAIYVQLTVKRAIGYLSNHFDRGHTSATLVSLHASKPLTAFVIDDHMLSDGSISEKEKAELVKNVLKDRTGVSLNGLLMKSFGESVPGAFLVLPDDALHHELVIPHILFTGCTEWVTVTPLYSFEMDPGKPWSVKECFSLQENDRVPFPVEREIRQDFRLLAKVVHDAIDCNTANWIY